MPKRPFLAAILLTAITSPTLADTWTDSTGAYKVEADFVSFVDGKVKLKRADGRIIDIPLARLSAADKQRVKDLMSAAKTDPVAKDTPVQTKNSGAENQLLSQIKTTATARLRNGTSVSRDGTKTPYTDLVVEIDFTGPPAVEAREFGFLVIDSAKTNGKPIQRKTSPVADIGKTFNKIGRFDYKRLDNGCQLPIEFPDPKKSTRTMSISGSLKLKTGGEKKSVSIKDLANRSGPVDDVTLAAAGTRVEIDVKKGRNVSTLHVWVNETFESGFVENVEFLNSAGEDATQGKSHGSGSDIRGGLKVRHYDVEFRDSVPDDIQLRLSLRLNPVDVVVPFQFDNLPVVQPEP